MTSINYFQQIRNVIIPYTSSHIIRLLPLLNRDIVKTSLVYIRKYFLVFISNFSKT